MAVLDGQVAIVTGASSGIGLACAKELAASGAAVVVDYYSGPEVAAKVVADIEAAGGKAMAVQADVSKEEDVKRLVQAAVDGYGGLDIMVSNAGLQRDGKAVDLSVADWNMVINTNLTGQFLCVREAARVFLKQGKRGHSRAIGKAVCMSSVHQIIPWAGHVNYSASKGGIKMMMETLAQEFASSGIRINAVAPGAIATPINASAREGAGLEKMLTLIPYGRVGEPEDIARVVRWLVSDEADYVVGATLFVDGAMSLYPGFRDNG